MDLSLSLDPMSYLPLDLLGWSLQIIPAAFGIWTERSAQQLARGAYFWSLVLRIIGLLVLGWFVLMLPSYLIFTHDPANSTSVLDGVTVLAVLSICMTVFSSIIMIRPLVRRLRDAGIEKKWAYLALFPLVDFIMFVGLIFYPPTRVSVALSPEAAAEIF